MRIIHLRTNDRQESEFSEIEIDLDVQGAERQASLPGSLSILFNQTEPGHKYTWHNAPRRQWVVTLQGEIEVRLRTGQSKRFGAGSLLLADDLQGSGHATDVVSAISWQCLYIPFVGNPPM